MQVNILGYGLMAKQIASLLYLGGFHINLWHYKNLNENEIYKQINFLKRSFPKDKIKDGKLMFYNDLKSLPIAVTIESVVENLEIKKNIYSILNQSKNLIFTNTSSYSPNEIGRNMNALHFFNPITFKVVELYLNSEEIEKKIYPIISFLEELDFSIIKVNNNRGYIGNCILFNGIAFTLKLVEKFNYSLNQVEKIYSKLYDGRDIINIIDVIGIDVVYKILKNLKEVDETIYLPNVLKVALENNILGKKNKTSLRTLFIKEKNDEKT